MVVGCRGSLSEDSKRSEVNISGYQAGSAKKLVAAAAVCHSFGAEPILNLVSGARFAPASSFAYYSGSAPLQIGPRHDPHISIVGACVVGDLDA